MIVGESAREYIYRPKGLASAVKCHGEDVTNEQLGNGILTGPYSHMHFIREGFAFKLKFTFEELEHAVMTAEEYALAAVSKSKTKGGQVGGDQCQGRNGTGDGHDSGDQDDFRGWNGSRG